MQSTYSNVTITGIPERSRGAACRTSLDSVGIQCDFGRGQSCVRFVSARNELLAGNAMANSYGERTAWTTDTVTDEAHALKFGPLYHSQRWRFAT
ncbi:MAG: hypothetical protein OEV40_09885 [Acidimicrobiia bacterium]|nr:hypothetical protein [Acidimicrobiia bacterium]